MKLNFKKHGVALAISSVIVANATSAGTLVSTYEKPDSQGYIDFVMEFDHKSSIPSFDINEDRTEKVINLVLNDTDSEASNMNGSLDVIQNATVEEQGGSVLVSLKLDDSRYYSLKSDKNELILKLKETHAEKSKRIFEEKVKENVVRAISDIDFKRDSAGNAKLIIKLNEESEVKVKKGSDKIRVSLPGTKVPKDWLFNLDVSEFATNVKSIDIKQTTSAAVLDVILAENMNHEVIKEGNNIVIDLKYIPKKIVYKKDNLISKEKINFNFENADLRSVIYTFATFTDKNIVISDTVNGFISLSVNNVSADEILNTILRIKGLDKRVDNNIILIAPAEELAEHERARLENEKSLDALSPITTEFISINYANAADIAALFEQQKDSEGEGSSADGALIRVDERTNTIIVTDTSKKIQELRKVVEELDKPVSQVMIESKIIITTTDMAEELGVKWGAEQGFTGGDFGFAANNEQLDNLFQGVAQSTLTPMIDMGVGAAATSFALGYLTGDALIGLELSALESEGVAEVISTPKVITSDKHEAVIEAGTDIPFQEASGSGATSTSFKKAVLSLSVTPQITPNNNVILDLDVKQDSVGEIFNGIPSIDTQHISTQVLVKEGETLVLGGIYKEEEIKQLMKTPLVGDLPIIGKLFQKSIENNSKLEMLVFVTPHVIDSVE